VKRRRGVTPGLKEKQERKKTAQGWGELETVTGNFHGCGELMVKKSKHSGGRGGLERGGETNQA